MVAQACESRRAQPCQGHGLGAFLALALAQKKALERVPGEVGNCRTEGRPSGACPLWAGQLSTEQLLPFAVLAGVVSLC